MIKISKNSKLILILSLFVLILPIFILAKSDDPYKVLAPLPCIESPDKTYTDSQGKTQTIPGIKCPNGNGSLSEEVDFKTYIQYTFNLLIALSAVLAVIMIIWGAIEYMLSGSIQVKSDGRKRIENALFGLLLILTSYIILRTVDPRLVEIPNTLVQKLEIVDWLAQDSVSILMGQLEDEVNAYKIKSAEIGKRLQATAKQKVEKLSELEKINKELKEFDHEALGAPEKYSELQVKKAKIEDELSQLGINFTKELAESAINGVLLTTSQEITDNKFEPEVAVKLLNRNKELIKQYKDTATAELMKKGEVMITDINNVANFSEAIMDSMRLEVIISHASLGVSGGVGIYGTSATNITMTTLEGGMKNFRKAEAKTYIENEIARLRKVQESNIDNIELKNKLVLKLNEVDTKYKNKPIFK